MFKQIADYLEFLKYKKEFIIFNKKNFFDIKNGKKNIILVEFNTNNFGLVQNSDIFSNQDSILFLGDSFTQGQGASPWINNFNGNCS